MLGVPEHFGETESGMWQTATVGLTASQGQALCTCTQNCQLKSKTADGPAWGSDCSDPKRTQGYLYGKFPPGASMLAMGNLLSNMFRLTILPGPSYRCQVSVIRYCPLNGKSQKQQRTL